MPSPHFLLSPSGVSGVRYSETGGVPGTEHFAPVAAGHEERKGVFANACIREGVNHQTDGERQRAHLKAIAQSSIHEGYREADQKERQEGVPMRQCLIRAR